MSKGREVNHLLRSPDTQDEVFLLMLVFHMRDGVRNVEQAWAHSASASFLD